MLQMLSSPRHARLTSALKHHILTGCEWPRLQALDRRAPQQEHVIRDSASALTRHGRFAQQIPSRSAACGKSTCTRIDTRSKSPCSWGTSSDTSPPRSGAQTVAEPSAVLTASPPTWRNTHRVGAGARCTAMLDWWLRTGKCRGAYSDVAQGRSEASIRHSLPSSLGVMEVARLRSEPPES
jgi:hypothetical protein